MTINTVTSPTSGGILPTGVTASGGLVVDLIGVNGVRVVAQIPASELFKGYFSGGTPSAYQGNPGTAGILSGLSPADIAALGGGISEMAVRITLYDGDNASGDLDYRQNTFLVNGVDIGNMSDVATETTDFSGFQALRSGHGFGSGWMDTGWFAVTDAAALADIHASLLSTGSLTFQVADADPYDNDFDFTRGSNSGRIVVDAESNIAPETHAETYVVNTARLDVDAANGVLGNDSDPDGTPLIATLVRYAEHGSVQLFDDGSFSYVPNADFSGTDSFIYGAYDGALLTEQLVTLTVTAAPGSGGPGAEIYGGKLADTLTGTTGDDTIRARAGDDVINAGTGNDYVTGDEGNDIVIAGKGNDRVDGGAGNDQIYGREGNDLLLGGAGNDRITGDAGNDTMRGQAGDDILSGGDGWDIFVFGLGDGSDTIVDFMAGDRLDLSATGLSFADLLITSDASGTSIAFGLTSVWLKDLGSVSASDFIF